jgi:hypothetical protein
MIKVVQAAFSVCSVSKQLDIEANLLASEAAGTCRGKSVDLRGNPWEARGFGVMMDTMMMTNERKIWEAALLLVRRHGAAAAEIAQQEVHRLRGGDDELTCVVWCWIARSTAELLRPVPSKGERVH